MSVPVDIWLRGDNFATTRHIEDVPLEPREWTDENVRTVIEGMLQAMHRLKYPHRSDSPVALRGLSWIVNPYAEGGVVIAIEITLGAAVAGPLDIDQATLEAMIARVLVRPPAGSTAVQ
jgi:hypothetical protein